MLFLMSEVAPYCCRAKLTGKEFQFKDFDAMEFTRPHDLY